MTTSIIYCSTSERVQIQSPTPVDSVYPITSAIVAANPSTATATLVSSTVTNAASGLTITSGSVPAATAGNLLVAVLLFGVSNVATTTNPSGWALNSMGGGSANKRLEVWSKRAVGGESGVFTWTKPSGSNPWACHIYEFSGSIAGGLVLGAAITNVSAVTTITPAGASGFVAGGILAFAASGTISAITSADGPSTASVLRSDDTWTYGAVEIVRLWNNQTGSPSTTFSWTTTRNVVWVAINLVAATTYPTTTTIVANIRAIGFDGVPGDSGDGNTGGQDILEFNTSSIGGDAISSATLGLMDSGSGGGAVEPANATLEAWAVTTPDLPTARGANDDNWYRGTASYGSLTKCATFPAASVWESLPAVLHSLTSEAAFPAQIQTSGTTRLMLVTDDLRLGTARTTDERYAYYREAGSTSNDPRITIVHSATPSATPKRTLLGVGT